MNIISITDLNDERLKPYRNLRERTLRGESIFLAEGSLVTERLLRSPYPVESLLISKEYSGDPAVFDLVPDGIPVYSLDQKDLINTVVGFEFYQGILAIGRRTALPTFEEGILRFYQTGSEQTPPIKTGKIKNLELAEQLETDQKFWPDHFYRNRKGAWLILPDATKPDNLGLVFRAGAALGAAGIVLGPSCCDPFSRRSLRVSMGGVLQLPVLRANDLIKEIQNVRKIFPMEFFATVLDPSAVMLPQIKSWPEKTAFFLGNEYHGLSDEMIRLCDKKLMIPMRRDVDSLNLGVSAGIFLYEYNRNFSVFENEQ